jgi:hypothetical protein
VLDWEKEFDPRFRFNRPFLAFADENAVAISEHLALVATSCKGAQNLKQMN